MKTIRWGACVALSILGCSSETTPAATSTATTSATTTTTGAGGHAGGAGQGGAGGAGGATGSGGQSTGGAGGTQNLVFDWSCVGHVEWPASDGQPVTATGQFVDFATQQPLAGLEVRACDKADPDCAAPHDTGTTDADGKVTLTAPGGAVGFEGYVRASGAGHVTTTFFFARPIPSSPAQPGTFVLLDAATLEGLASQVGHSLDPARGHVAAVVEDCVGVKAAGLTLAADTGDAQSATYYLAGKTLSASATRTDASGAAALLDLPAGPVTITSTLDVTKETIGTFAGFVRAGELSSVVLPPTP